MNELSRVVKPQVPTTIEDLSRFVLIGREKLISVRAEIRAIEKLGLATEVREQKRDEAQFLAGALLDAESRIGEIIKTVEKEPGKRTDLQPSSSGGTKLQEMGITKKQSHYFQILAENPEIIEQVKAEAVENDDLPTRTEVLRRVKEKDIKQRRQEAKILEPPQGKYRVIYADPPWQYSNSGFTTSAENQYPTMPTEEICNLPIKDLADENAVLFLWATSPLLEDALRVCRAWGFDYKTNFVWIKNQHTGGFYCYGQHELLFIATRGSCLPNPEGMRTSIIQASRREHSRKPDEVYGIIEAMYNDPRIELFARNTREGWTSWGVDCPDGILPTAG